MDEDEPSTQPYEESSSGKRARDEAEGGEDSENKRGRAHEGKQGLPASPSAALKRLPKPELTAADGESLTLAWESVPGAAAYKLAFQETGGIDWLPAANVKSNGPVRKKNLLPGTSYNARVKPDMDGWGWSPVLSATTAPAAPSPPPVVRHKWTKWQPFYLMRSGENKKETRCLDFADFFAQEPDNQITHVYCFNFCFSSTRLHEYIGRHVSKEVNILFYHGMNDHEVKVDGFVGLGDQWNVDRVRVPGPFGTHHTKMLLLFYEKGIRVVIYTGNLRESELKNMTQGAWIGDFPRKEEGAAPKKASGRSSPAGRDRVTGEAFGADLAEYLTILAQLQTPGYSKKVLLDAIDEFPQIDFSSADVVLIPAVPGKATDGGDTKSKSGEADGPRLPHMEKFAQSKMRQVLREHVIVPARAEGLPLITCLQPSTISSLGDDDDFLKQIGSAFRISKTCRGSGGAKAAAAAAAGASSGVDNNLDDIHLVWPSVESVRLSVGGYASGGSIVCESKFLRVPAPKIKKSSKDKADDKDKDKDKDKGKDKDKDKDKGKNKKAKKDESEEDDEQDEEEEGGFHEMVVFDAAEPVEEKKAGGLRKSSEYKSTIKAVLRQWEGYPSGKTFHVPHIKTYCRYFAAPDGKTELLWCYLGSANLSMAAWGLVKKDGSSVAMKSFELGVLFIPSLMRTSRRTFSNTPNHPLLGIDAPPAAAAGGGGEIPRLIVSHEAPPPDGSAIHFPLPHAVPAVNYNWDAKGLRNQPWAWDIKVKTKDSEGNEYKGRKGSRSIEFEF